LAALRSYERKLEDALLEKVKANAKTGLDS
jgi:hypothetical protein